MGLPGGHTMQSPVPDIFVQLEKGQIPVTTALRLLDEEADQNAKCSVASVEKCLAELNELIGLNEVKDLVKELYAFVEVQRRRTRVGLAAEAMSLHMIFRGNPGTGKTTVARVIGKMLKEVGILKKGHLVEVERADLVGEYIGHTAQKTREQIKRALGGILFVDEAYSLARGGEKDFGKECIDVLVKAMEDHRNELVLILAGYRDEMARFLQANPGLRSRFPIQIEFPDYSPNELLQIAELMLKKRQYRFTSEAREAFFRRIEGALRTELIPGNARMVRNMVEKAIRRQALRLVSKTDATMDELMTITVAEVDLL
ncbi:MAG TPA: AAA family ATPase [Firmicutes bacterium]|nr:AAA family ATPase [Bacillota bacterium]